VSEIRRGSLADHFSGVAAKRLSAVETDPARSHQHEFNGANALRRLFGDDDRRDIPARFVWLGDEQEGVFDEGRISWYDALRKHPKRTEYSLCFPANAVMGPMREGDFFLVATLHDGTALLVIARGDSNIERQLRWLFGLDRQETIGFETRPIEKSTAAEIDFVAQYILQEIGISYQEPEANLLDRLIEPFGYSYPQSAVLSGLARSSLKRIDALLDPDLAIIAWLEREEHLFKRLERRIVSERLIAGFANGGGVDFDGFHEFSLSYQNTRMARAGLALENHLEALFRLFGLRFARHAVTEGGNKPDFLFPGTAEYHDPSCPVERLTVLGSKSSLKDRWRQVIPEADRIPVKHLATLEPGISSRQTDQMRARNIQLVVPRAIHATFAPAQAGWLMDLASFIRLVRERER
jgi:hypothetical protein